MKIEQSSKKNWRNKGVYEMIDYQLVSSVNFIDPQPQISELIDWVNVLTFA
jgi:hypothetical protein